jgi:hypothetical protein
MTWAPPQDATTQAPAAGRPPEDATTATPPQDATTRPAATGGPPEDWMTLAPAACTLPRAERPLRAEEFQWLFAAALRGLDRPERTLLRLALDGSDEMAAATRELVARESACCSFFEFRLTPTPDRMLLLEIRVPTRQIAVLDGLAARAAAATGGRSA